MANQHLSPLSLDHDKANCPHRSSGLPPTGNTVAERPHTLATIFPRS